MNDSPRPTAASVNAALERSHDPGALVAVRKRLAADEPAIGVRMGTLFEIAKSNATLVLDGVQELLDHPAYEPRLAAICILDFKARRKPDESERAELAHTYIERHDRITTWDMVDRAAPWVVGGHLAGKDVTLLDDLAGADQPLRRRTAMTAPLWFVRYCSDNDVAAGWRIAAALAGDSEPVVSNAVGIFAKHAGGRDRAPFDRFLADHARRLARPALRLALSKLPVADRRRWLA